jgi:hypothetical protein
MPILTRLIPIPISSHIPSPAGKAKDEGNLNTCLLGLVKVLLINLTNND